MTTLSPKIYVACLAAYNNGKLHGHWIDATQDIDALQDAVNQILASSPITNAEEWAIHDYEDFGGSYVHEYAGLEAVAAYAAFIAEHDILGGAVLDQTSGDIEEASRLLEECYHGEHESEADFAQSITEDTSTIPENLACYIDYERMARDLFICDFFSIEINYKYHVFSNY